MFSRKVCLAAALLMYGVALWIYWPLVSGDPYQYDEADYMWAGRQGIAANYTDQNGLSFVEFVQKGLELSRNSGARQSFSEYIRSRGDIGLYRHYHGPLYAYWLAVVGTAGANRENVFRGSGLLIHGASALLILFGIWAVFPSLPRPAALAACALFIFNKTALTASTTITQHLVFTFLGLLSLFAAARFMRDLDSRWFYATMSAVALAFCAVETSALILPAIGIALAVDYRRVREKWPSVRRFAMLLLKGAGAFVLTMLVFWPTGVLRLGVIKGFLTLAYIAVARKTFSPIGPAKLLALFFEASPWEVSLLIAGGITAFIVWRRFPQRRELLPWLAFIGVFFLVLLKVTAPYTYYFAPLTAALTVACGVAAGALWNYRNPVLRAVVVLAVAGSVAGSTWQYRSDLKTIRLSHPYHAAVLRLIAQNPVGTGRRLYLPYQMVPTLHFYDPDLKTVGYDVDYPLAPVIDGVRSREGADYMLCEETICAALDRMSPGFTAVKELIYPMGPNLQPLYVVRPAKNPDF